jgi:VCBS repeat-containing protein
VSGSLAFFDVDQGVTPGQWSVAPLDENQTSFGSATIDAISGEWIYNLDQSAADVLGTEVIVDALVVEVRERAEYLA